MALRGIPLGVRGYDGGFALGSIVGCFWVVGDFGPRWRLLGCGPKSESSGRHGLRHGRAAGWHGHQLALGRRETQSSEGRDLARSDRATWHDRATLVKPRFLGFRDLGFAEEQKHRGCRGEILRVAILRGPNPIPKHNW